MFIVVLSMSPGMTFAPSYTVHRSCRVRAPVKSVRPSFLAMFVIVLADPQPHGGWYGVCGWCYRRVERNVSGMKSSTMSAKLGIVSSSRRPGLTEQREGR